MVVVALDEGRMIVLFSTTKNALQNFDPRFWRMISLRHLRKRRALLLFSVTVFTLEG